MRVWGSVISIKGAERYEFPETGNACSVGESCPGIDFHKTLKQLSNKNF